jgi:hypothetical protein
VETILADFGLGDFGTITAATTALGTAASGLVDASKAFKGGISNIGFAYISAALRPFEAALKLIGAEHPFGTVQAAWLNGVDKTEQKSAAKNLIRLGLTADTATSLAAGLKSVDGAALQAVAAKVANGTALTEDEVNLLARFDSIIEARLDAAYERADQKYRNVARVAAAVVAMVLSVTGAVFIAGSFAEADLATAIFVGFLATPLAPVSKDLMSALSTAVAAFKATKR